MTEFTIPESLQEILASKQTIKADTNSEADTEK